LQIVKEEKKKRKSFGLFDSGHESFDSIPFVDENTIPMTSRPFQSEDFNFGSESQDFSNQMIPFLTGSFLKEKPSLTSSKNYVSTQKEVFSNWMSYILNFHIKSENIQKYFRNCIVPLDLVEKLTSIYAPKDLLNFEPTNRNHEIENATKFLNFMEKSCNIQLSIRPEELVDGELDVILNLIWCLILKYQIYKNKEGIDFEKSQNTFHEVQDMVEWVNDSFNSFEIKITNLKTDLVDGKVLIYLLHKFDSTVIVEDLLKFSPNKRIVKVIELAKEKLKIPSIINEKQIMEEFDLLSNLTYLSFFKELDEEYNFISLKPKLEPKASFFIGVDGGSREGNLLDDFGEEDLSGNVEKLDISVNELRNPTTTDTTVVFQGQKNVTVVEKIIEKKIQTSVTGESIEFQPNQEEINERPLVLEVKKIEKVNVNVKETSKDIFKGLKQRRKDSITKIYKGDYIGVNTMESIRILLNLTNESKILFSGIVTKLTDKTEDVIWVITEQFIYELDRNIGNIIKNKINISKMTGMGFSTYKDGLFVLYFPNKNDHLYESIRKTEICEVLMKSYKTISNGNEFDIVVDETIKFNPNPVNFNILLAKTTVKFISFVENRKVDAPTISISKEFMKIEIPPESENPKWEGSLNDEKGSIYSGQKMRNRSSVSRQFIGDYLALKNTNRMNDLLERNGEKQFIFVDRARHVKFENISENQKSLKDFSTVIILITDSKFYILMDDAFQLKVVLSFKLKHVKFVFTSKYSDNYMLIRTTTHDEDFLFHSPKKTEIISILSKHALQKIFRIDVSNK
jgi:hypothetical protein